MADTIRVLFFGDVVGLPGRSMFQKWARKLKEQYKADALVVNGENSADNGRGITEKIMQAFKHNGADVVTSGNHIWAQRSIYNYFTEHNNLVRPANFPSTAPGKGYSLIDVAGHTVAVVNLQGRVFMHEHLDCPFRTIESLLTLLRTKTNIIFVDFHAETTSEKQGMSYFLDGKVSGVYGTHTHVQTADERILPKGTSYITDLGFAGARNSMLGMKTSSVLERFLTQMPSRFVVEKTGPMIMCGISVEIDTTTGKALHIERFQVVDEDIAATME